MGFASLIVQVNAEGPLLVISEPPDGQSIYTLTPFFGILFITSGLIEPKMMIGVCFFNRVLL